ncbi:MAG: ABC transporter permease [Eubacterium sp.]|nr:ABC transporter permease [Eubacterium sp.]
MKNKIIPWLEGIAGIVLLLIIWYIASVTGIFGRVSIRASQLLLPLPSKVFHTIYEMVVSGYLLRNLGVSLLRVLKGFILAVVIGIPIAIFMGLSQHFHDFINPLFRFISPIPGVAWVPLAILWFGLGDKAAIFIITMGSLSPIITNTLQGVQDVDPILMQALETMGATRWQMITKCVLPSIIPYIATGFRLGLGFAWRVLIAAELVGVPNGIGYVLSVGRSTGQTDITIVTIICLGVMMIIMDEFLFNPLEKLTKNWRA